MRTIRRCGFVGFCAALLAAQAACGDAGPVVAPSIPLTVVAAAAPLPTGPTVVNLVLSTKDGVFVDDKPAETLEDVVASLARRAKPKRMRYRDGSSRLDAVLYVDEAMPWAVVQWVLQACVDEKVMAFQYHFAVKHRASGQAGVVSDELPKDRGGPRPAESKHLKLRVFPSEVGPSTTPEHVYAAIRRRLGNEPSVATASIETPAPRGHRVPAGFVIAFVAAIRSAGVATVDFTGYRPPTKGARLRDLIAKLLAEPSGTIGVKLDGVPVGDGSFAPSIPDGPAPSAQTSSFPRKLRPETKERDSTGPVSMAPPEEEPLSGVEETEQVHASDVVAKEPTVTDTELVDDLPERWAAPSEEEKEGPPPDMVLPDDEAPAPRPRGKQQDDGVELALKWLASHQSPDGRWAAAGFSAWCDGQKVDGTVSDDDGKASSDVGVTGLALLAYLGAGYTNRSDGPFGKVVASGLRFLRNEQDAEGCFGPRADSRFVVNHAIATLAVCEGFAMTESTNFRAPAQKALDFIALARNPYLGWRYGVKPGDNDTFVTAWMTMALVSARRADEAYEEKHKLHALTIDDDAFAGVRTWLDTATDPTTGRVAYTQRGTGPSRYGDAARRFPAERSESLTAMGTLLRALLGEPPKTSETIARGLTLCAAQPPRWDPSAGTNDFVYWYFGTLAMFQRGGEPWNAWSLAMKTAIIDTQRQDGDSCHFKGSWDPIDPWRADGGRVYATAMLALCAEVWYRYEHSFGTQEIK